MHEGQVNCLTIASRGTLRQQASLAVSSPLKLNVGGLKLTDAAFWKQLDAQNDEKAVRVAIASGHYSPDTVGTAREWLRHKEEERSSSLMAKRDAREEETLSIAKEANSIAARALEIASSQSVAAFEQARWAKWAAIVATIAALIATKDQIAALVISWLQ